MENLNLLDENKPQEEIVDLDTHMKIYNFLIHIQSIGVISEAQRIEYANYIQDYLKERKYSREFLENILKNHIK